LTYDFDYDHDYVEVCFHFLTTLWVCVFDVSFVNFGLLGVLVFLLFFGDAWDFVRDAA
jgi:hypothetical protein